MTVLICFTIVVIVFCCGAIMGLSCKHKNFVRIDDVIAALEKERKEYHYASKYSLGVNLGYQKAIDCIKRLHIEKHPRKYLIKTYVYNDSAKKLLDDSLTRAEAEKALEGME